MRGKFVIGLGAHAGSRWLSTVLNRPELGLSACHEGKSRWISGRWRNVLPPILHDTADFSKEPYNNYAVNANRHLEKHDVFTDINSWDVVGVSVINKYIRVNKVFVVIRNGINQLYSVTTHSSWNSIEEDDWLIRVYLPTLWKRVGAPGKPWEERTLWEKLCTSWVISTRTATTLRDFGYNAQAFKFENLISDIGALRHLLFYISPVYDSVSDDYLIKMQGTDINRKVPGDRDTETLWNRWSEEQQDSFLEICGEEMRKHGYDC